MLVNSTDTVYSSVVSITCTEGYLINGQPQLLVTCEETAEWSQPNLQCLG